MPGKFGYTNYYYVTLFNTKPFIELWMIVHTFVILCWSLAQTNVYTGHDNLTIIHIIQAHMHTYNNSIDLLCVLHLILLYTVLLPLMASIKVY